MQELMVGKKNVEPTWSG